METFTARAVKISGNPVPRAFSLSFETRAEDETTHNLRGKLFGVVEVSTQEKTLADLSGPKLLEFLREQYFTQENGSNLPQLKKTLSQTEVFLKNTLGNEIVFSGSLMVIIGNILYVASIGKGAAKLRRNGKIFPVVCAASGYLRPGDRIFLTTESFTRAVPPDRISEHLLYSDLENMEDAINVILHNEENEARAAALILDFTGKTETQSEETAPKAAVSEKQWSKPNFSAAGIRFRKKIREVFPQRGIYLSTGTPPAPRKKIFAVMAAVALFFLVGFSGFKLYQKQNNERRSAVGREISHAQEKIDLAKSLYNLDNSMARSTLSDAKSNLTAVLVSLYGANWPEVKNSEVVRAKAVLAQIDKENLAAANIYTPNPVLFYDLKLLKDLVNVTRTTVSGGKIYVLDGRNGAVLAVDEKSKAGSIIGGGPEFTGGQFLTVYGDYVYVWTPEGIYRLDSRTNKKEIAVKKDGHWQEIAGMSAFGGNLYLLDKRAGQIWKYIATEAGFTDIKPYLNADLKPDFSGAADMSIDGAIYVLSSAGEVAKFVSGREDSWGLSQLDQPLSKPAEILSSDTFANIYLWDEGNHRIVVVDNKGQYLSQYRLKPDLAVTAVEVDETQKKIYLFSGSQIYTLGL